MCVLYHENFEPYLSSTGLVGGGGRMQRGGGKHALNFEVFELRKRNITTDKSQRVYKKNGAIYIFIMFTPGVMVIKMSKMAFLVFSTG